jgi:hypothetical protein
MVDILRRSAAAAAAAGCIVMLERMLKQASLMGKLMGEKGTMKAQAHLVRYQRSSRR